MLEMRILEVTGTLLQRRGFCKKNLQTFREFEGKDKWCCAVGYCSMFGQRVDMCCSIDNWAGKEVRRVVLIPTK